MALNNIKALALVDGIKTLTGDNAAFYKHVVLRETNVADERRAAELSERAIQINGVWQLLPSEEVFQQAMAMLACEKFTCEGFADIDKTVLDLDLFGTLSKYDLQAIQNRILLIESAAQLRHGLIDDAAFADLQASVMGENSTPSSEGQEGETERLGDANNRSVAAVERLTPAT